jgi:hypothetical protein
VKKVVLDDYRIEGLAKRADVVRAFPFFTKRVVKGGAGCCPGRSGGRNHVDYPYVKRAIVNLTLEAKAKLKELAGVDLITVYPPAGPDGVSKPVTF